MVAIAACVAAAAQLLGSQSAVAAGGDFSLDFTAAAPLTYNHLTGGGTYDVRQVGRDKDIVESLEGGDFACGDTVSFLTQIRVDAGAIGSQTIRLRYEFTAHAPSQPAASMAGRINLSQMSLSDSLFLCMAARECCQHWRGARGRRPHQGSRHTEKWRCRDGGNAACTKRR